MHIHIYICIHIYTHTYAYALVCTYPGQTSVMSISYQTQKVGATEFLSSFLGSSVLTMNTANVARLHIVPTATQPLNIFSVFQPNRDQF